MGFKFQHRFALHNPKNFSCSLKLYDEFDNVYCLILFFIFYFVVQYNSIIKAAIPEAIAGPILA